jgi:hypothetical protein
LPSSPAAIHWGAQLYTLVTAGLLFLVGRKLFSARAGVLAAGLLLLTTADPSVLGNAFNTETVMILPLVAGLLAALKAIETSSGGWAFLTGVLSAAGLLGKQVALPNAAFHFLLLVTLGGPRLRLGLLMAAGVATGLAPAVGYFAAAGALPQFWDCVVGYNLSYASSVPLRYYPGNFLETSGDLCQQLAPVFVLAAAGLLGLCSRQAERPPLWLAAGWLTFSLMGVCTGGIFREHYFIQVLPAVCLLAGVGAERVAGLPVVRRVPAAPWLLAGLCAIFAVWQSSWYYLPGSPARKADRLYCGNPFVESAAVARLLAEHSRPDEPLFVLGSEPQIYFYANRRCASRYIFVYPLMSAYADTRERQREVLRELHDRPPRLLVDVNLDTSFLEEAQTPRGLKEGIRELLRSYELVAVAMPDAEGHCVDLVTPASGSAAWARARRSVAGTGEHSLAVYGRVR